MELRGQRNSLGIERRHSGEEGSQEAPLPTGTAHHRPSSSRPLNDLRDKPCPRRWGIAGELEKEAMRPEATKQPGETLGQ